MSLSEFELIDRFFRRTPPRREDTLLGIGDDAAVVHIEAGTNLHTVLLQWVEHQDFDPVMDPLVLGHRLLAFALGELARQGAQPAWMTLSLTLPAADPDWLEAFSQGLARLAERYNIDLVGGDTSRGPRVLRLHVHGLSSLERPRADNIRTGDLIYVSGPLGDSGLAILDMYQEVRLPRREREYAYQRFNQPEPRLSLSAGLYDLCSAVIPLTHGLATGLQEQLSKTENGASLYAERIPISTALQSFFEPAGGWLLPLTSPEAGELCLIIPESKQMQLQGRLDALSASLHWVGQIERNRGIRAVRDDGTELLNLE